VVVVATISALNLAIAGLVLLSACGGPSGERNPSPTAQASTTTPTVTSVPTPSRRATPTEAADPRWQFFVADRTRHTSPWYDGARRVMIGYGCTPAPFYDPDPRCPDGQGFHHGIDVAMPCGTPLYADVDGVVLDPSTMGTPGAAYGERAFRIRSGDRDVLIGHARRVFVQPGDRVRAGQRIALASDSAAPDGCHLHFEVRRTGGGVTDAVDPAPLLQLS